MRDKYPYLKDPRALAEIRKHKWLESQKAGQEIGFASAAVDWVKKHGEEWKKVHAGCRNGEIFIERRKYRRFELRGMVQLAKDGISVLAEPINLSFFGLLCKTNNDLPLGSTIKARMSFELKQNKRDLECCGRIERVVLVKPSRYDVFLNFNECCQKNLAAIL